MDPPKRPTRPIVLLALVCLLCVLARIQLDGMDSLSLQRPLHSFVDSDRAAWAFVMLVLAIGAATALAIVARDRLNFLLVVGFSGALGGIVLARIDPSAGMVFGALAAELVIFPPLRQVMAAFLVAGASLVFGAVAAAFALATERDMSNGLSLAVCAMFIGAAGLFTAALFWAPLGRIPVVRAINRRGRLARAMWLAAMVFGLWLGLSVDTVRRFRRFEPTAKLDVLLEKLYLRPLAVDWFWRGPLGVQDVWAPGATDLTDLRAWPELEGLLVGPSEVVDDDLKSLANSNRLSILHLNDTRISDEGLFQLRALTRLFWLDLSGTRVRGEGLRHLAGLTTVRVLTLDRAQVSDDGLAHFPRMQSLSRLELRDTQVTGPGLRHLGRLPVLITLALDGCPINDEALKSFADMPKLTSLSLERTPITDESLRPLSHVTGLEPLALNDTAIGDEGLRHLTGLTSLGRLELRGTKVTDAGLETLAGVPCLQTLDVGKTAVTRAGVERLKRALPGCFVEWDD